MIITSGLVSVLGEIAEVIEADNLYKTIAALHAMAVNAPKRFGLTVDLFPTESGSKLVIEFKDAGEDKADPMLN